MYDLIVVGMGPSSIFLAYELIKLGKDLLKNGSRIFVVVANAKSIHKIRVSLDFFSLFCNFVPLGTNKGNIEYIPS